MVRTALIVSTLLLTAFSVARSDEQRAPWEHITSSASGRYYFRMVPANGAKPAHGTMYRTRRAGSDDALWSVSGWYAQRVFVPDNGESLVRLGDWPHGLAPQDKHLGVAFYTRGKLVRRYSTKDLVKDVTKVRASVSHYQFHDWNDPPALLGLHVNGSYHKVFRLRSIDGITYLFDFTTGKIINQSPSDQDIVADERTAMGIAEAVLRARFGTAWEKNKPLQVTRLRGEWHVNGTRPASGRAAVYHARIQARDGCVIRLEKRP